ncbi:hypothetical protein BJ165DRAFT_1597532 [Panaeolus papilionaceus]|nr:hypothetical protein BJ165DRAFT_1597532 [Panaeolus papilionaceus]
METFTVFWVQLGLERFVEAFAGAALPLNISKDQLSGYTQHVNAYRLDNVYHYGAPVYLIDTPGLADPEIAGFEIVVKIRKWLDENSLSEIHHILYTIPINETRLSGSKRRVLDMFQSYLGAYTEMRSVTFVTTMWNLLSNERAEIRMSNSCKTNFCRSLFLVELESDRSTHLPTTTWKPAQALSMTTFMSASQLGSKRKETTRLLTAPHHYQSGLRFWSPWTNMGLSGYYPVT